MPENHRSTVTVPAGEGPRRHLDPDAAPSLDSRLRAVAVLALGVLLGVSVAIAVVGAEGPRYTATSTILVTGEEGPGRGSLFGVSQYTLDRSATWAELAQSQDVAEAAATGLGIPVEELGDSISADSPTTQPLVVVDVTAPEPDLAVARAAAVGAAVVDRIAATEELSGAATPRVRAAVIDTDAVAEDSRWLDTRLLAVPAAVIGFLVAWTVLAIRRPGKWVEAFHRPLGGVARSSETRRIDRSVQFEVLGALLLGQSRRGLLALGIAVLGVLGFALTGSPLPPLIVVLAAGLAGLRDLRFAAGGILFAGVTVLPGRIEVIALGPLTLSVVEIAVGIAVLLTLRHTRRDPSLLPGIFTAPVLAIIGAFVIGSTVAAAAGVDQSEFLQPTRVMGTLATYFVFRAAFRGRPAQLFAVLLTTGTVAATMALAGVALGFDRLEERAAEFVVTGDVTAEVFRVNTPILELWAPLLIVLAAGVVRLRPRLLWAVLLVPALTLLAMSFDRSTWATLLMLAVVVGVLRGGRRGLLIRAAAAAAAGVIAVGGLSAGVAGPEGQAVAQRVTSVLTGQAFAEDSLPDRLRENVAARDTLRESPYLGTGIGAPYGAELPLYNEQMDVLQAPPRPWIHNQYYRIWLWTGVVGLLAFGALAVRVIAVSVQAWRRRGQAATLPVAAAAGLGSIAIQATFATSLVNPAVVISVAVVLALIEMSVTEPDGRRDGAHHERNPAGGVRT